MRRSRCPQFALVAIAGLVLTIAPQARAQPRPRPAPTTRADIDRLDKKIDEQQRRVDRLIKLQLQYLQALAALSDSGQPPAATTDPRPPEPKVDAPNPPDPKPVIAGDGKPRPPTAAVDVRPRKPKAEAQGTVVGKITGASDAIVYVDDLVVTTRGTAVMAQDNKAFQPAVLVVQKGTTVEFPNHDAVFHNVFSVTRDHSFDLGSYRQGETRTITMSRPGVVSVYCNMHPQMVGHILVVPNGNFARVGKDGSFRLVNVPAGHHRIVAWAPDAKPVATETEVSDAEAATVELELQKTRSGPHLKKDGLPYGSYEK